jgi:TrmH family RNA methyltransferase
VTRKPKRPSLDASDFAKPTKPAGAKPPEPVEEPEEELDEEAAPDEEPDETESEEKPHKPTSSAPAASERRDLGPLISSRKNARIHLARALATRRGRKREGKFLIEGVKVIRELLGRGVPIELVLWKDGLEQRPDAKALIADLKGRKVEAFGVAPALFDELVDTESSQGLLAVAPMQWRSLEDALGPVPGDPENAEPRSIVVAAGVQDPGNLGTILRSARFLGFAAVACLSGTTDPWAPKVVRASSGALIDAPPARVDSLADLAEKARARGFKTIALSPRGGKPLEKTTLPRRSVLLLGAEGPGLTTAAIEGADEHVTLAASDPAAESLNAAMAFAIFAYVWRAAWTPPAG